MFILAVKGFEEDGAFSIENNDGDKVLLMFEEEDDADRYADLISVEDDYPEMSVIEVDDFVAMRASEMHDYMYNINYEIIDMGYLLACEPKYLYQINEILDCDH